MIPWPHASPVYISVAISDSAIAIDRFTACVSDINAWMRASRLRLNPTKTQVIWLGSGQLMRQVNICDVPVLSTQVKPVESARDLGVIIDTVSCRYQLTLPHSVVLATINSDSCVHQRFGH